VSEADRLNGLRWRLRAMRRLWRPGARPHEHFLPAVPVDDPTGGRLDHPQPGFEFDEGTVGFTGWAAFADGSPLARVEGTLDGVPLGLARTSLPRPDVEGGKNLPLGRLSGFDLVEGLDVLPANKRSGAMEMKVVATSVRGERVEFDPVPVFVREPERLDRELITLTPPPPSPSTPAAKAPGAPPRTLVFTHQLTLGGAQLLLQDLIGALHRLGFDLTVVSVVDGPLREELEDLGITVHITSTAPFEAVESHVGRIGELVAWTRDGGFEVALVNTATSAAALGGEVAAALGIPCVWAIHESFPAPLLWADLDPEVRERTEAAIGMAAGAVFEADATRRMYEEELIPPDRCVTLPYGVDPAPIEAERAKLDVAAARREAGIGPDERVVLCVGTVEPRKAQVQLAQAFSVVAAAHPDARLVFVGAREENIYTEDLEAIVADLGAAERIDLIGVTPDVQRWYGIADILVCASDVESLPRTVLEAMLWEVPVLATEVFGLPELITDGETGWLYRSRDLGAMADGLDRALTADAEERHRIAGAARRLVEERHSLPRYGEEVATLLRDAVAAEPETAVQTEKRTVEQ
jgi:D-inositol-3-phosphate glycosyltransferase